MIMVALQNSIFSVNGDDLIDIMKMKLDPHFILFTENQFYE